MHSFGIGGLWGSGNTVTERALVPSGQNTVYNMWNGVGLIGPRAGEAIERYPALWARIDLATFMDRYGSLDDEHCRVFEGAEVLGIGCEQTCASISDRCGEEASVECLTMCGGLPRERVECIDSLDDCEIERCAWGRPEERRERP